MISDANMYAEVYEILKYMNKQEVMRVPVNILEVINKKRSKTYKTRVDKFDLFNLDNIDGRTVNFLAWLMIDYMADGKQRQQLINIAKENDRKREEEKKNNFNVDVFENKINQRKYDIISNENNDEEKSLVVCERESLISKIVRIIKNIFKI